MKKKAAKKTIVKMHFPQGHLGASGQEHPAELIVRALSLKHAKPDEWADKYGTEYEDDVIRIHPDYQDGDCTCAYDVQEKVWLAENAHSEDCFVAVVGKIVSAIEAEYPLPPFDFIRIMGMASVKRMAEMFWGGKGPTEAELAEEKAADEKHERERVAYFKVRTALDDAVRAAVISEAVKFGIPIDSRKEYGPYIDGAIVAKYAESSWEYHCTCGREARRADFLKDKEHVRPCWHWWAGEANFLHKPSGFEMRWYKYIGRDTKVNMQPPKELLSLVTETEIKAVLQKGKAAAESFANIITKANEYSAKK